MDATKALSMLSILAASWLYIPTEENKDFQRTIWNEDIEEDIFSYIKKTPEFNFCKDKVFSKIEIYLDET